MKLHKRWLTYESEVKDLIQSYKSNSKIAKIILGNADKKEIDLFRKYIASVRNLGFKEVAKKVGVENTSQKMIWFKTKDFSVRADNPDYLPPEIPKITQHLEKAIDKVLSKFNKEYYIFCPNQHESNLKAIKVTISDDHVGLEPNPNNNGLFKYEYNAEIYTNSYEKVFNSVLKEFRTHGKFDLLLFDNLGDEQDGWNGLTTRGGHELPQNMTNAEVFETCIDTKVKIIKSLVENNIANKIILRKVTNDNHSGDFGHTINLAVKKIINLIYSTEIVEVETLTRFLEHRIYGDHCFILTHGKDVKQMFRGLPLKLDDKTINYINDYLRFYDINSKFVHVEKGDLHQIGYNKCNTFDYRNFMSFAPPSSWVQHNFGDCYSGYSIQVIPKFENEISHTDYFLDYKKLV
jgi:hypothetical protein